MNARNRHAIEPAQIDSIPECLRQLRQWVLWRYVLRPGEPKPTKVPYQAAGNMASTADAATWCDFDDAMSVARSYDGIGYVFAADDPYCGIDLDGCFDTHGTLCAWAVPIVSMAQECGCYIERTPSGCGLHVIGMARLPGTGRKIGGLGEDGKGAIEVYDRLRYFTVTGDQTDIGDASGDLTPLVVLLWDRYGFGDTKRESIDYGNVVSDTEAELLMRRVLSQASSDFIGHWTGRWDAKQYPGPSEARMGLLVKIAMKLGPAVTPAEVQAVALRSGLIRDEIKARGTAKWPRLAQRECERAVAQARQIKADGVGPRIDLNGKAAPNSGPADSTDAPFEPPAPILVKLDETSALRPAPSLIRGILPADAVGMVWAPPASFKSFLTLDWALCVASGHEWLGHPVKKGVVWYLAGEGQGGLRARVQAWRQARNFHGPVDFLHSQRAILLDSEQGQSPGMTALLNLVESGQAPDLIVVDTLARSMVGDESATRDASRYVSALDELVAVIRKSGKRPCVVLVHHARKDGEVYRGSSVLRGAADFEFEVRLRSEFSVSLECHKLKDGGKPPTVDLRLELEQLGNSIDDFGIEVTMTSLAFWVDRAERRSETPAEDKATSLLPVLRQILGRHRAGLSQRALMTALRESGTHVRTDALGGYLDLLVASGDVVVEPGPNRTKVVRLKSGA